jgi:hypothetical protein
MYILPIQNGTKTKRKTHFRHVQTKYEQDLLCFHCQMYIGMYICTSKKKRTLLTCIKDEDNGRTFNNGEVKALVRPDKRDSRLVKIPLKYCFQHKMYFPTAVPRRPRAKRIICEAPTWIWSLKRPGQRVSFRRRIEPTTSEARGRR